MSITPIQQQQHTTDFQRWCGSGEKRAFPRPSACREARERAGFFFFLFRPSLSLSLSLSLLSAEEETR